LAQAPAGAEAELASYVEQTAHPRSTGMAGLRHTTWRVRPGEWFEGTYVFVSDQARAEFQRTLAEDVVDETVTRIIGSAPVLVETSEVVAVAEGWDGFRPAARA
jgi:hypothetical protein